MNLTSKELCQNMPKEYSKYLDDVKNLEFEERPRYKHFINSFLCLLSRMGIKFDDNYYDWNVFHKPLSENKRM